MKLKWKGSPCIVRGVGPVEDGKIVQGDEALLAAKYATGKFERAGAAGTPKTKTKEG